MTEPARPPGGGMTERKLRILVVDDHDIVHWGLRLVLARQDWVERCVPARTGDEAEAHARRYEPHVALVDLFLGDESGMDVTARILRAWPPARVLLLSGAGRVSAAAARAAGAQGFITKDLSAADIALAVRRVASGQAVFDGSTPPPPAQALSPREREVLELVAAGLTNAEIAKRLHLSPNTIKEHASTLYRKLGARNRAEAVLRAQRLGVLA
jgi:two-component system response regulator DesR